MLDHHSDDENLGGPWSIVLGGGDSQPVRPLIAKWLGRQKPKPFCAFLGTRSLWQHSIDRAIQLSRRERVIAVVNQDPNQPVKVNRGDRIAQLLVVGLHGVEPVLVEELSETERGDGGFGSTGS